MGLIVSFPVVFTHTYCRIWTFVGSREGLSGAGAAQILQNWIEILAAVTKVKHHVKLTLHQTYLCYIYIYCIYNINMYIFRARTSPLLRDVLREPTSLSAAT